MKILITGCDGQLGKELTNMLSINEDYQLTTTNKKELNICDFNAVNSFIIENKFDVVINCSAYTKVDLCETNKEKAFAINSLGAKNIAMACDKIGAKVVYISTDYVFSGENEVPYCEYDQTNPQSIYGKSKAHGEAYTRIFASKYFIIRTAWLYGDGHNFVKTMLKLSETKDSLNVVDDQVGTPTSTKDLAKCIIDLINTENYGTYHGTCNGSCSWYEFACKIFELKNIDIKVNPTTSEELKSEAPRPKYSILDNFMLKLSEMDNFRNWKDALKDYLEKI